MAKPLKIFYYIITNFYKPGSKEHMSRKGTGRKPWVIALFRQYIVKIIDTICHKRPKTTPILQKAQTRGLRYKITPTHTTTHQKEEKTHLYKDKGPQTKTTHPTSPT